MCRVSAQTLLRLSQSSLTPMVPGVPSSSCWEPLKWILCSCLTQWTCFTCLEVCKIHVHVWFWNHWTCQSSPLSDGFHKGLLVSELGNLAGEVLQIFHKQNRLHWHFCWSSVYFSGRPFISCKPMPASLTNRDVPAEGSSKGLGLFQHPQLYLFQKPSELFGEIFLIT